VQCWSFEKAYLHPDFSNNFGHLGTLPHSPKTFKLRVEFHALSSLDKSLFVFFIVHFGVPETYALAYLFFLFLFLFLWNPQHSLHVACGVGASTHVIHSMLKCYPEAVLMRTTMGSTPKQCLNLTNAANKEEVKKLSRQYFSQIEARYRPVKPITSELLLV
jgi:hypothetical protein